MLRSCRLVASLCGQLDARRGFQFVASRDQFTVRCVADDWIQRGRSQDRWRVPVEAWTLEQEPGVIFLRCFACAVTALKPDNSARQDDLGEELRIVCEQMPP